MSRHNCEPGSLQYDRADVAYHPFARRDFCFAGHQRQQPVVIELRANGPTAYGLPVAEHHQIVADLLHFRQTVRDEYRCHSFSCQFPDFLEHTLDLNTRQAGGRLVEDENARFSQQGASNFDELLLRTRKFASKTIDIEVWGKPRQRFRCCRAASFPIDDAESAAPFGSQKQISPDRQV